MTSELKVDKITPASGTNTQIGEAGDTTNLSAGTVTLPTSIITGQSAKTSLADADKFLISDSAASGAFKYVESQYIGGGGLIFLGGTTLSGTVTDIALDHFSSTYDIHKIYGYLSCVTAGADIGMRLRDGGSDITSSNYIISLGSNWQQNGSATNYTDFGNWLQDHFNMISGSISSGATIMRFEITIFNAMSSTFNPAVQLLTSYYRTANQYVISMGGGYVDGINTTTCEGIKFIESSGNGFDAGAVRVYGVVSS